MHDDLDFTALPLFVLLVALGIYTEAIVGDYMDKADRLLARALGSDARAIECCVWEYRRRYPNRTRPAKVSSRFIHNHEARIAPKATARNPYAHRGWDVSVTLEHGTGTKRYRNDEHSQFPCKRKVTALVARPEMGKAEHIAEELAHARELDDLDAIERYDDWLLDLEFDDQLGRAYEAEPDVLSAIELLDDLAEMEADELFIAYEELMQAPTEVRPSYALLS